jgi:uncharacterized protein YajQ (UPF0234 family)
VLQAQTQTQESQVRVNAKDQEGAPTAVAGCDEHDFGIATRFTNYR